MKNIKASRGLRFTQALIMIGLVGVIGLVFENGYILKNTKEGILMSHEYAVLVVILCLLWIVYNRAYYYFYIYPILNLYDELKILSRMLDTISFVFSENLSQGFDKKDLSRLEKTIESLKNNQLLNQINDAPSFHKWFRISQTFAIKSIEERMNNIKERPNRYVDGQPPELEEKLRFLLRLARAKKVKGGAVNAVLKTCPFYIGEVPRTTADDWLKKHCTALNAKYPNEDVEC